VAIKKLSASTTLKLAHKAAERTSLEDNMFFQFRAAKLELPVKEFRFHDTRQWRFDFAWVNYKLAVEIEGGGFVQGGHHRGAQFEKDCMKYNSAILNGWSVLRFGTNASIVRDVDVADLESGPLAV